MNHLICSIAIEITVGDANNQRRFVKVYNHSVGFKIETEFYDEDEIGLSWPRLTYCNKDWKAEKSEHQKFIDFIHFAAEKKLKNFISSL